MAYPGGNSIDTHLLAVVDTLKLEDRGTVRLRLEPTTRKPEGPSSRCFLLMELRGWTEFSNLT